MCGIFGGAGIAFAQEAGDSAIAVDETAAPVEAASSTAAPLDESALLFAEPGATAGGASPVSGIFTILRILFVLALVAAAIYALVMLLKKGSLRAQEADPYLKVISRVSVTSRNSVAIISAGGKVYIVMCGESGGNLVAEITDKETVDAMLLENSQREAEAAMRGGGFAALLKRFIPSVDGRKRMNRAGDSLNLSADNLRRQRERLGKL